MNDSDKRLANLKKLKGSFLFSGKQDESGYTKPQKPISNNEKKPTFESNRKTNEVFRSISETHQLEFEMFQLKCDILSLLNLINNSEIIKIKDKAEVEKMFSNFRTKEFHVLNNLKEQAIYGE